MSQKMNCVIFVRFLVFLFFFTLVLFIMPKLTVAQPSEPPSQQVSPTPTVTIDSLQIQAIIGQDDRVRVADTRIQPWPATVQLIMKWSSGEKTACTGFFMDSHTVATAAHCLHDEETRQWAKSVIVTPARNDTSKPFGSIEVNTSALRASVAWVNDKDATKDYGAIILPDGSFSNDVGSFNLVDLSDDMLVNKFIDVAGYPGDKKHLWCFDTGGESCQLWHDEAPIVTVDALNICYAADTMSGQSGGPVWYFDGTSYHVVAIHHGAGSWNGLDLNCGTRMTAEVIQAYQIWSSRAVPPVQIHADLNGIPSYAKFVVAYDSNGWKPVAEEYTILIGSNGYSTPMRFPGMPLSGFGYDGGFAFYLKPTGMLGKMVRAYLPPTNSIVTIDFSPTAGSQFHLADGNEDNKVNELDYELWRRDFIVCQTLGPAVPECSGPADFNKDGTVDIADGSVWRNFSQDFGAAGTVGLGWPETGLARTLNVSDATLGNVLLSWNVSQTSYVVGDVFDVDVILDTEGTPTSGAEIMIRYDPGVLQVIDVDTGSEGVQIIPGSLYPFVFINEVFTDEGVIWFSSSNTGDTVFSGTGTLAEILFHAVASIETTSLSVVYHSPNATTDTNVSRPAVVTDQLASAAQLDLQITGTPTRPLPAASVEGWKESVDSRLIHLQATASDIYNQLTHVNFWVYYNDSWSYLGADNDPADGWNVIWDAIGVPEQVVYLFARAVVFGGTEIDSEILPFDLDYTPPFYVNSFFYPTSGASNFIYAYITADDNLSGVEKIQMYFNTDRSGSDSGEWIYVGEKLTASGIITWDTKATYLTPGIHRIVFGILDRAGNWNTSNAYITYNFGKYIYLPLVVRNFHP